MFQRSFCILALFHILFFVGCAQVNGPMRVDPEILTGRLDNGMTYYIRRNDKPAGRVEFRLAVRAGSVLEAEDQRGLAHFCEHMAFNGTTRFEKQKLVDYLESIGMQFGPNLNAYTSMDKTVYQLQVPVDKPGAVQTAIKILYDWAFSMRHDDVEIEKERGVIMEEWRLGRGAYMRILDKQLPVLMQGSRYAERLPIGKKEVLESFTPDRLRAFYTDWYRPDLMAVVVVGAIDPQEALSAITEEFSGKKPNGKPAALPLFEVPSHKETLVCVAGDPEATQCRISAYWKLPPSTMQTAGDYRRDLVARLGSGMLNQRLDELRQKADAPFMEASVDKSSMTPTRDAFSMDARVRDGEFAKGLEALLMEAERVRRHGFTETEVERMKTHLMAGVERAYNERNTTESYFYARIYAGNFTENTISPGIEAELKMHKAFLPKITLQEINAMAREWLTESNRVVLISSPEKADVKLPDGKELLALYDTVAVADIKPYIDDVATQPLLPNAPLPGKIMDRQEVPVLGITIWKMSNGTRVVLKATDFKEDQIVIRGFRAGGSSLASDGDYIPAASAGTVLSECGLGAFSKMQLDKKMSGKIAWAASGVTELREDVFGGCRPQDLEVMMQLLYLKFTAPRTDGEAYAAFKERLRSSLVHRLSRPEVVFADEITATMTQNHLRYRPWTADTVDQFDIEKSLAIYRDRFSNANGFVFFVVGTFDLKTMEDFATRYIGSLPSSNRVEAWKDVGMRPPSGKIQKTIERGIEPKSRVQVVYTTPCKWSRVEQLRVEAMIAVLNIRLREKIREELGGTYSIWVYPDFGHYPVESLSVTLVFGCSPDQVEPLLDAASREITRMMKEPIDDANMTKVKQQLLREYEVNLEKNEFWLDQLSASEWNGDDPGLILEFGKSVEALTKVDIQQAAKLCFETENVATFMLKPAPVEGTGGAGDQQAGGTLQSR